MTGEIKKEINAVTDSTTAEVTDKEMELINAYSRRKLTKDEVYVFGVVLCDNDIDRDNERFTVESLFKLEKLFVGKTGIFDHSPTAKNQTARILPVRLKALTAEKRQRVMIISDLPQGHIFRKPRVTMRLFRRLTAVF